MDEMFIVAVPVFCSVTTCAALDVPTVVLPKVRLDGETVATGTGALTPLPLRGTVCGDPAALSTKVNAPDRAPMAVGVNVMLMLQLKVAAKVAPQVLAEMAKSPLAVIDVIFRVAFPVFWRETD